MSGEKLSEDSGQNPVVVVLPVAMGLVTVTVVVLDGTAAAVAGTLAGVGLVVAAGLLQYRAAGTRGTGESD